MTAPLDRETTQAKTAVVLARCIVTLSHLAEESARLAEGLTELAEELKRGIEAGES